MATYQIPVWSSWSSGMPGMLMGGTEGMPLNPPSSASPTWYWLPEVAFMSWNRITETVRVMTPMYASEMRP